MEHDSDFDEDAYRLPTYRGTAPLTTHYNADNISMNDMYISEILKEVNGGHALCREILEIMRQTSPYLHLLSPYNVEKAEWARTLLTFFSHIPQNDRCRIAAFDNYEQHLRRIAKNK